MRIRMLIDFYKYLFKIEKNKTLHWIFGLIIFLLSSFALIYQLFTEPLPNTANMIVTAIFVLSIIGFIFDVYSKLSEIKQFYSQNSSVDMIKKDNVVKEDKKFQLQDIKGCYAKIHYKYIHDKSFNLIYAEEINYYLMNSDFHIEIDNLFQRKVKTFIKRNADMLIPFLKFRYYRSLQEDASFYNGHKLCLGSDILTDNNQNVIVYESDYFSSFLTNEISSQQLFRKVDTTVLYDARNFYPITHERNSNTFRLISYEISQMNNHIGISTLALTVDNYLVIRHQGDGNQKNKGKLVPTGSGSLDVKDLDERSFKQTIINGMERELIEENHIKVEKGLKPMKTKVIGHFSWLERGGKPEFVGISKLSIPYRKMEVNTRELKDADNATLGLVQKVENIDDLISSIDKYMAYDNISSSLVATLIFLKEQISKDAEQIEQFLFRK